MLKTQGVRRVVVVGAGPIGVAVAGEVARRPDLTLVAVVDVDPSKAGKRVESVVVGPAIVDDADVAIVCTTSSFVNVAPTIRTCLGRGLHVVSTCEELVWPWLHHRNLAESVDDEAIRAGRAVVGTGVNPGFLMDALPVLLTAICARVEKITVVRAQDAALRRVPFQQKVGVGLSLEQWQAKVRHGGFLHRGLMESAALIAHALGLTAPEFAEEHTPMLQNVGGDAVESVRGVEQRCTATVNGAVKIDLRFEAWAGHPNPRDEIVVEGEPRLHLVTQGVLGDVATRAIAVNAVGAVMRAPPGLRTMLDLPLVSARF